jgi:hypothetical protein
LKKYDTEAERLAAIRETKRRYSQSAKGKQKKANYANRPDRKVATREWQRQYRKDHPENDKRRYVKSNILRDSYAVAERELLAGRKKPEVCDACGSLPGSKGMHFDHCHQNGWFRGWLCSQCNMTLGLVKDDPNRLRMLIAYLERTKDGAGAQFMFPGI